MGLGLHQNAKNLIKEELVKGLPAVLVENGNWVESMSVFLAAYFANRKLPSTGKLSETLLDRVGDLPVVDFVNQTLRRDVNDTCPYEKDAKGKLTDLGGFQDVGVLAESLVERFDSLLWRYNFTLEFSESTFPKDIHEQPLPASDLLRLTVSDLFLDKAFPLTHDNEKIASRANPVLSLLNLFQGQPGWQKGRVHLQSEIDGFVGIYGGTPTVNLIQSRLESFIGLGIANRIFSYEYKYDNPDRRQQWIVHRRQGAGWEFDSRFDIDSEIKEVLRHVSSFKFSNDYPADSRVPWITSRLKVIERVFSEKDGNAIILSGKWLFDSYKNADDSLKFVRLMTALEILLGERLDVSKSSIGETIGNRLAYSIGKSRSERIEILDYFKNIYRTRSKILHNGKHRLIGEEKNQLSKLTEYSLRALLAECDALTPQ